MAEPVGMERLSKCPKNRGCRSKLVFRDANGNLWTFLQKKMNFVEHRCSTKGSYKPETLYLGEWYNIRTETARYVHGRLEQSVYHSPSSVTQPPKEWVLKAVYETVCDWKEIPIQDSLKKR